MLYDSSEPNHDNAEPLIVMGDDPLISQPTAPVPVMSATARRMKRQAGKALNKTDPNNTQTIIQTDWQTINQPSENRQWRSIERSRLTSS